MLTVLKAGGVIAQNGAVGRNSALTSSAPSRQTAGSTLLERAPYPNFKVVVLNDEVIKSTKIGAVNRPANASAKGTNARLPK